MIARTLHEIRDDFVAKLALLDRAIADATSVECRLHLALRVIVELDLMLAQHKAQNRRIRNS